ncbi:MAG TPA: GNAT family N-acetyltransferase [Caulobacteraceae bacterium]|nr:GNAT family N-acetyltransferase [Caulobacteraceae bacterium]
MAEPPASAEVRVLAPADAPLFERIADGVFDHGVQARLIEEFLNDPRHSLSVAIVGGMIVGMASGVRYVHPDKPSELWINEVGVSPGYQRRGLAKRIVAELLAEGRRQGCREAWVLTDYDNLAARATYKAVGGVDHPTPQLMVTFPLEG